MKKIYFLFTFLFFVTLCFSQTKHEQRLDSLYNVLSYQKEDTLKVDVYGAICKELLSGNTKKINFYNNKILKLSQELKYQKGFGLYYVNLSMLFYFNSEHEKTLVIIEKAKNIFYKIKDWDNYFYSCAVLGNFLTAQKKIKEAKTLFLTSIQFANKKRKLKVIGKLYYRLSLLCVEWDMPKDALIYANLALKYHCDKNTKSNIYNNIAGVNIAFNNFEQAAKYINLALSLVESPVGKNYMNIRKIDILIGQKKYKEALATILESKKNEKILDQREKDFNIFYLSICYYHLKKYDLALQFVNEVLNKQLPNWGDFFKVQLYTHLSAIYLAMDNKIKAKQIIDVAINLFDPEDLFELELKLYTTKYRVEEALGNYQEALVYFKKISNFKDKNTIRMNQEKLSYLQASFEINDKNYKIKKLETAQLLKAIEVKKQKNYILLSSIALVFSFLLTLFFIRTNKIIKLKNSIIEIEKLRTQKSLQEKEILLKEIHHRVKNNMQTVISLLKIQSLDAKELSVEDFISVSETRINSMIMVHENLYQNHDLSKVDFKEYLNNLTTSIKSAYQGFKKIEIQIDISNIYFDVQTAIPIGLIVNELVNNAYKHAFKNKEKGIILIQITQKDDQYQLMVSDDGLGITNHQINHNGLGLELVRLLISQIKGILEMDNSNGTSFKIKFKNVIV